MAPENMSQTGFRVSLSFEPDDGRMIGGPITTEGLTVEMENDGCLVCQNVCT